MRPPYATTPHNSRSRYSGPFTFLSLWACQLVTQRERRTGGREKGERPVVEVQVLVGDGYCHRDLDVEALLTATDALGMAVPNNVDDAAWHVLRVSALHVASDVRRSLTTPDTTGNCTPPSRSTACSSPHTSPRAAYVAAVSQGPPLASARPQRPSDTTFMIITLAEWNA